MSKVFAVIEREIVSRVRTRAFVLTTLLLPLLMAAMLVLPALMMQGSDRTMQLALVDGTTGDFGPRIEEALRQQRIGTDSAAIPRYAVLRLPVVTSVEALRDSLVQSTGLARAAGRESFDGVLVVTDSALLTGQMEYLGDNVGSFEAMGRLEGALRQVLMVARLQKAGIDPAVVAGAMSAVKLRTTKVTDGKVTGASGADSFILAYVMGFLLYLGVMLYGQQTATSVVEEKNSRIMEILASSLTPFQMLLGKVLGVGLTGLLQMGIWGGTAFLLTQQRVALAGLFGVDPAAIQTLPIPVMAPDLLVIFLGYFLLGFLLYGALYAGIGALCNTVQEVQQSSMPVMMLIMVGFFAVFALLSDPSGGLGRVMSLIPFFAPLVMPVRYSLVAVPPLELALSLALTVAAILCAAWLAGRIYRTGILMYGKRPGLREVLRWVRR